MLIYKTGNRERGTGNWERGTGSGTGDQGDAGCGMGATCFSSSGSPCGMRDAGWGMGRRELPALAVVALREESVMRDAGWERTETSPQRARSAQSFLAGSLGQGRNSAVKLAMKRVGQGHRALPGWHRCQPFAASSLDSLNSANSGGSGRSEISCGCFQSPNLEPVASAPCRPSQAMSNEE